PHQIPRDHGRLFIDQSAFRSPRYTFGLIFKAIDVMQPNFVMSSMKLVTDRTNFRKLLEFVGFRGIGDWKRFEVEIIGDTMFFIRWNLNNAYVVDEREGKGPAYGYSTPQELTAYDKEFKGSTPHHRILEYNLGDMKYFVRFEVDAVIEE
ncbi:hypothetical protein B0J14DRAFT_438553, partial [Halenospora varia]